MKKGDICFVEDYQEFGQILVELISYDPKTYIWNTFMLDSEDRRVIYHYQGDTFIPFHVVWISSKRLIPLVGEGEQWRKTKWKQKMKDTSLIMMV